MRYPVRPLYTGLRVRNLDRSVRFYQSLGLRQTIHLRTAYGEAVQLEHPPLRFTIELNYFPRGSLAYEPYRKGTQIDHFGFLVDEVDGWARRLCRVGGKVMVAPYDTRILVPPQPAFNGRVAYAADPDGIWVELMGPHRQRPKGARGHRREARPRALCGERALDDRTAMSARVAPGDEDTPRARRPTR